MVVLTREIKKDATIIGAGPAGLGAAWRASELGLKVALIEKEEELGGILMQCIHDGFGVKLFNKSLSGPEFAELLIERVREFDVETFTNAYLHSVERESKLWKLNVVTPTGVIKILSSTIIFATGARERTWFEIGITGTRPAGVYTAGTVQRMINLYGLLPGKRIVIVGGGDVGLIVARHLILEGAESVLIVEIKKNLTGLPRNIQQCVLDFNIPYRTLMTVKEIVGKKRVEGVILQRVDENGKPIPGTEEFIPCDSVVFCVGLIPEKEKLEELGAKIDPRTKGPEVNEFYETTIPGIFAAGNLVQIFDFVDDAVKTAFQAAQGVSHLIYKSREKSGNVTYVVPGDGIHCITPQRIEWQGPDEEEITFYFRPVKEIANAIIKVIIDGEEKIRIFRKYIRPARMEEVTVKRKLVRGAKEVIVVARSK